MVGGSSGVVSTRRQAIVISHPTLALSPHGNLRVEDSAELDAPVDEETGERIAAAFHRGQGHGLAYLGTVEVSTLLPPTLAFWRDFARRYVTRLCARPDLEKERATFSVAASHEELSELAKAAPPMKGGEYISQETLERLWSVLEAACREELREAKGSVEEFLHSRNPVWNLVGRVHFHLAEQKRNPRTPFAFLATYTTRPSAGGAVKHLPLGRALEELAAGTGSPKTRGSSALLKLLRPVQAAAEKSAFLRELVDSRSVFHPLAWTPREALLFLKDVELFEEAGVVVKMPDWWKSRSSRHPQVRVTVGGKRPAALGLDAMLDFSLDVVLDGEPLSTAEVQEILAARSGLALIRGRWVEIDHDKLRSVLEHWDSVREAAATGGISFAEGMRLLAGADSGPTLEADAPADSGESRADDWSIRRAGPWLEKALDELNHTGVAESAGLVGELDARLRPYQRDGVLWLWKLRRLGLGGCLADDMGLGKTIQVLGLALAAKRSGDRAANLLVVPASLLANWTAEIRRFAPDLETLVAHSSVLPAAELKALSPADIAARDLVITSYGSLGRLAWAQSHPWGMVILDEAQAIKNPSARQTRTVKALRSGARFALTGTPVENRLSDLWSIFDFINPGLLGSAKEFASLAGRMQAANGSRFAPLRKLVAPYILRRLKTDRAVVADLPDKTEVTAYCSLTKTQAALYNEAVTELATGIDEVSGGIQRRGLVLAFLSRFKQICNHPSHWLGDGAWDPAESGKFARLREIAEALAERQEKVLVFTQYRQMVGPLSDYLGAVFGRPGVVLHGGTPVKQRGPLVERFQADEAVPFFVLSLKAGGTGLNLTAASHVIHFDRWWNPAVEDQATDRAYRIGQDQNVLVHKFVCRGTVEEKIDGLIREKRQMSSELLASGGETAITELANEDLLQLVALDIRSALAEK